VSRVLRPTRQKGHFGGGMSHEQVSYTTVCDARSLQR